MKKFLKFLIYLILVAIIAFGLFLLYGTITDYQPPEEQTIYRSTHVKKLSDSAELSLLIWNIGYCGLSDDMDFFYDGGKQVRPPEKQVKENCQNILGLLREKEADIYLLQEVDRDAKRSYGINQYKKLKESFPNSFISFAKNYDVPFVPMPINNPMGRVEAGLVTVSGLQPQLSTRYSFPGNFSWPMKLFILDRCFLVNRYPVEGNKELIVINTHNSAYDDGNLKLVQMQYLKDFLMEEYNRENYIIVGGDWNQLPYGFDPMFSTHMDSTSMPPVIPKNFLPNNWQWVYDKQVPTNRSLDTVYLENASKKRIIDFYLVSPNIRVNEIKGMDLQFKNADHQPVFARFQLN